MRPSADLVSGLSLDLGKSTPNMLCSPRSLANAGPVLRSFKAPCRDGLLDVDIIPATIRRVYDYNFQVKSSPVSCKLRVCEHGIPPTVPSPDQRNTAAAETVASVL
jgi:hypothetical protein